MEICNTRLKTSALIKAFTVALAILGVTLSFVNAREDGYSHWSKRLLYFTGLSNIWIILTFATMLAVRYVKRLSDNTRVKNSLYILRYVFTVSITLTGFIFCTLLGPGAKYDGYNAWTFSNVMTHAVVPTFAIVDFFVDGYRVRLSKKHVLFTAVPPFVYMLFALILGAFKIDFGRGDPYPYIFFNLDSPAGIFGFSNVPPYIIGTFYWMLLMLGFILSIGIFYRRLYNGKQK